MRDDDLLDSALAQPRASFAGKFLHPTIAAQAGAYFYHIAMNHPLGTSINSLKTDDWHGSMGISATAAPQSGN